MKLSEMQELQELYNEKIGETCVELLDSNVVEYKRAFNHYIVSLLTSTQITPIQEINKK